MKATLTLALFCLFTYFSFGQDAKNSGLSSIKLSDGVIYKKTTKLIETLPSSYYKSTIEILSIEPVNDGSNKSKYIVIEGVEVIGSTSYKRSGLVNLEQAKTLLKFLAFASDSVFQRAPQYDEEISLKLNSEFSAVIFNTNETTWNLSFTVDSYHKHSIFFKSNSIYEIINSLKKAISELDTL